VTRIEQDVMEYQSVPLNIQKKWQNYKINKATILEFYRN